MILMWVRDSNPPSPTVDYIYGLGSDKTNYVRSDDLGFSWKAVSPNEYAALNKKIWMSCLWQSRVSNRSVVLNPTSLQMENQMLCELLAPRACSLEKQKFSAMHTWATTYPNIKWSESSTMVTFLDTLLLRAKNFKPEFAYSQVAFQIFREIYNVRSLKLGPTDLRSNDLSFALMSTDKFQAIAKIGFFNKQQNVRYIQSLTVISEGTIFKLDESFLNQPFNGYFHFYFCEVKSNYSHCIF